MRKFAWVSLTPLQLLSYTLPQSFVIHLVKEYLTIWKLWSKQKSNDLNMVFLKVCANSCKSLHFSLTIYHQVKEKYPHLLQYDGNWVVSDFLKIYLKNSAGRIEVQCIISIGTIYCLAHNCGPPYHAVSFFVSHFKYFKLSLTPPLLSACSCLMVSKLLLFQLGDIQCLSTPAAAFVMAIPVRLCRQWHHPCCTSCFKIAS